MSIFRKSFGDEHPDLAYPYETLGEILERRGHYAEAEQRYALMLGVVPSVDPGRAPGVNQLLDKVLSLTRLGFSAAQVAQGVTITPTCGLAGATPPWARQALVLAHRTADALADKAS